jgi:hypothetical protein
MNSFKRSFFKPTLALLALASLALASFAQTAPVTPAPVALQATQQPTVQQLGQELAASMQGQAATQNTAAVAIYNQAVAAYAAAYGTSPNSSAPAAPVPPMLTVVDTAAVASYEVQWNALVSQGQYAQAAQINWSSVYSQIPYVPIVVAPVAPAPVVIGAAIPGEPGFFTTVSGDSPAVPAGTIVTQAGHSYKKYVYGPFGSVMWQQVS